MELGWVQGPALYSVNFSRDEAKLRREGYRTYRRQQWTSSELAIIVISEPEGGVVCRYRGLLRWTDQHHKRTGAWPHRDSGPVHGAPGETWLIVDLALHKGIRGLQKSTLPQLLAEHRGVRNVMALPRLTEKQILAWAEAHKERTGKWPTMQTGPVQSALGETWLRISHALCNGWRGLPGGSSLAQLLAKERNARNHSPRNEKYGTGSARHPSPRS